MQGGKGMTERERIAYRLGFDDGLAVMRQGIKDLLLENERLRKPILDRPNLSWAGRELADAPQIRYVFVDGLNGHALRSGNGGGRP